MSEAIHITANILRMRSLLTGAWRYYQRMNHDYFGMSLDNITPDDLRKLADNMEAIRKEN